MTAERPATLYDVALLAHVSHQTVSRVVNRLPSVASPTRERVLAAMAELDYQPNQVAKQLASGRSRRIGVLAHQMYATGPAAIFRSAFEVLQHAGYQLDVAYHESDGDPGDPLIAETMARFQRTTSGILAMPQTSEVRARIEAANVTVPLFTDEMLDRGTPDRPGTEELIGRVAAEYLTDLGHRDIGHLVGPAGAVAAEFRRASFGEALATRGISAQQVGVGDWSFASGYSAGLQFIPGCCTAVFVANDEMAIGFLRALHERGIRVPEDLSVLGVDDLAQDDFVSPALSSVIHDFEGEGQLAALTLIADIEGTARPIAEDYIRVSIQERESTARHI